MTGRARESLFSILDPRLGEASVLDLYAGSGSLGLEALSRGASDAVFVERSARATRVIADNIEAVGLGGIVVKQSTATFLTRTDGRYDIVFVDPPYADDDGEVERVLASLDRVLRSDATVVVHRRAGSDIGCPEFLTVVDQRQYGDAIVTMYRMRKFAQA